MILTRNEFQKQSLLHISWGPQGFLIYWTTFVYCAYVSLHNYVCFQQQQVISCFFFYFYNFAPKLTISAAAVVINEQIQPPNLLILGWGSHLNLVKTWVEFKLCLMFECLIFNPSSYHQRFIHWFEPTVNLVISYDFMPLFCEFCKMSPWF